MIKSGIYLILNTKKNRYYIGSTVDFSKRKSKHFKQLLNNKHKNQFLQNDYNQCGKKYFKFKKLCFVEPIKEKLLEMEQFFIDWGFDNQKKCYNISPTAASPAGVKRSQEFKNNVGNCHKHNSYRLGKKQSKIEKEKRSNSLKLFYKNNPYFIEQKKKNMMGEKNHFYNKKHTQQSNEKNRIAKKNKMKAIIAINVKTNEQIEFESIKQCSISLTTPTSGICLILKKKRKTYKGYTFIYK